MLTSLLLDPVLLPGHLPDQAGGSSAGLVPNLAVNPNAHDEVCYPLGPSGGCTGQPRLTIFVLDDSASVTDAGGNDPLSRRYAEARLAVRTLAQACWCEREAVGVFHFDEGPLDVAPVVVGSGTKGRIGTKAVLTGLTQPEEAAQGLGSSELGPALGRVEAILADPAWAHHRKDLVILTDFELLDADPMAVLDRLGRLGVKGVSVTAVILGGDPDGPTRDRLVRHLDASARIVPIGSQDAPGTLARALFGVMTTGRKGVVTHV